MTERQSSATRGCIEIAVAAMGPNEQYVDILPDEGVRMVVDLHGGEKEFELPDGRRVSVRRLTGGGRYRVWRHDTLEEQRAAATQLRADDWRAVRGACPARGDYAPCTGKVLASDPEESRTAECRYCGEAVNR